ncbi:unnamed protein product [Lepeophtheirus salmonis]|uniref:(salmon louse) hypothetical protein n=1 Tax=Lepeophtheirus salmonis TaxID=72036 RepID=A0A7R8H773_LEPSM|nr:unnamed protein product [Lepeophtheirus salmonis]CAF2915036.1 unnamed protein product [Lepeophtheirus salmonis]
MSNEIQMMVKNSDECQQLRSSKSTSNEEKCIACYPVERVLMNVFNYGRNNYLVMADISSGFLFAEKLRSTTLRIINNIINEWFMDFGYSMYIRSDKGPQFHQEFTKLL